MVGRETGNPDEIFTGDNFAGNKQVDLSTDFPGADR